MLSRKNWSCNVGFVEVSGLRTREKKLCKPSLCFVIRQLKGKTILDGTPEREAEENKGIKFRARTVRERQGKF